jgi:hypothetical protein
LRVERGTRGAWVLRDELGVREGGEQRQHEGRHEGGPDGPADLGADFADERIDARAEDVADDEDGQQPRPDRPPQVAVLLPALAVERRPCRGGFHLSRFS